MVNKNQNIFGEAISKEFPLECNCIGCQWDRNNQERNEGCKACLTNALLTKGEDENGKG